MGALTALGLGEGARAVCGIADLAGRGRQVAVVELNLGGGSLSRDALFHALLE